ncbi:hypothetical protein PLCT1_02625 [Planctomycetaceae bacterium]|nr:hypothetical protein PLCT1_02625 [Planctomycetaceae bacterium]
MRKAFDLRPLDFGDILSRSFSLYITHFSMFAGLFLLFVFVPAALIQIGEYLFLPVPKANTSGRLIEDPAKAFIGVFVWLLEVVLAAAIAGGGIYFLVSRVYMGAKTNIREAIRAIGAHFGQLLATGLIVLVAVGALSAIFVVPFIVGATERSSRDGAGTVALSFLLAMGVVPLLLWLFSRYGLVFCAVMLEDQGADEAFSRSAELTKGYAWRLIGLCTVMLLCYWLLQIPTGVISAAFAKSTRQWQLVGALIGSAWTSLMLPLIVIPSVIYYFDLRCRKEGFDLAVLAATFGVDPNFIARLQATGRYSYDIPAYVPKGWDAKKQPAAVIPQMPVQPAYPQPSYPMPRPQNPWPQQRRPW